VLWAISLLVACSLTACSTGGHDPAPRSTPRTSATLDPAAEAALLDAVDVVLTTRERAIRAGDEQTYAALLADPTAGRGPALLTQFATLAAVPWAELRHDHPRLSRTPTATPSGTGSRGATTVDVLVPTTWRLAGERADTHAEEGFTVTLVGGADGGWRIVDHTAPITAAAPWWAPRAGVTNAAHGLVVGTVDEVTRTAYAQWVERAHELAVAAWPSGAPMPPLVVVAPATATDYLAWSKAAAGTDQVAAVTDGPLDATGRAVADRVLLNPDALARLSPDGRAFVIAHEAVHVRLRAELAGQAPLWLSEGFADHVAYAATGLTPTTIAADALAPVRAGNLPTRLPDHGDFNAEAATIGPTYQRSWVLVTLLVDRHGVEAVREFIRAAAIPGTQADAEAAADRALVSVLGTTRAQLLSDWQARLQELAEEG